MAANIGNFTRQKLEYIIQTKIDAIPSVTPTIAVEESDGSPAAATVSTIKVSNGTLTDDGSGTVTINTAGDAPTAYTKRFIIEATACTDEDNAQDIAIYTKTANEGISNVRVRWGSTKWNYGTSIYFSVGFKPTGGSLDNDSMAAGRLIDGVAAGVFVIAPYFNHGGPEWVEGDQGTFYPARWDYFMHSTLAHYQEAGDVYVGIQVGSGEVADIDEGTIEVFLDLVDPGAGTTIS